MATPRIVDLNGIEFEHGINEDGRAFVKIRCLLSDGVAIGSFPSDLARKIAADANQVASRADYEADAWAGLTAMGMDEKAIGAVLYAVRDGELKRETGV